MITYQIDKTTKENSNEVVLRLKNQNWGPVVSGHNEEDAFEKFKSAFLMTIYLSQAFKNENEGITKPLHTMNYKLILNDKEFTIKQKKKSKATGRRVHAISKRKTTSH